MTTDTSSETVHKQKTVKRWLIMITLIYSLLLLPLFGMAYFSVFVFDSPNISAARGLTTMFLMWLIPICTLTSLFKIWSHYSRRSYRRVYFFLAFPVLVFSFVVLALALLDWLLPYH